MFRRIAVFSSSSKLFTGNNLLVAKRCGRSAWKFYFIVETKTSWLAGFQNAEIDPHQQVDRRTHLKCTDQSWTERVATASHGVWHRRWSCPHADLILKAVGSVGFFSSYIWYQPHAAHDCFADVRHPGWRSICSSAGYVWGSARSGVRAAPVFWMSRYCAGRTVARCWRAEFLYRCRDARDVATRVTRGSWDTSPFNAEFDADGRRAARSHRLHHELTLKLGRA